MARKPQDTREHDDPTAWEDQFGHVHDAAELWELVFEQNILLHETSERVDALEDALRLVHRVLAEVSTSTS